MSGRASPRSLRPAQRRLRHHPATTPAGQQADRIANHSHSKEESSSASWLAPVSHQILWIVRPSGRQIPCDGDHDAGREPEKRDHDPKVKNDGLELLVPSCREWFVDPAFVWRLDDNAPVLPVGARTPVLHDVQRVLPRFHASEHKVRLCDPHRQAIVTVRKSHPIIALTHSDSLSSRFLRSSSCDAPRAGGVKIR
jgi:hypothetical protein